MKNNKQGKIIALGMFLTVFSLMVILWLFSYNFLFQVGDENLITPLNNFTLDTANQTNVSAQMITHLSGLPDEYRSTDLQSDLYFVIFFASFLITALIIAAKARKEPPLSLFGTLTMGIMLYFLVVSYIETVKDWLIENLIVGVLSIDISNTFIINAYIQDMILINYAILLILIIVNQMDFSFVKNSGGRIEP